MDMGPLAGVCRRAVGKIRDLQNAAEEVGEALVSSARERFETGESPSGEKWKESERVKKKGGTTLRDKSHLYNSIGYKASPNMVAVGAPKPSAGSPVEYAAIHQFGGETGRNHSVDMPARPYIGISEADIEEARAILLDHIKEAFS